MARPACARVVVAATCVALLVLTGARHAGAQSAPAPLPSYHVETFTPEAQRHFTAAQLALLEKLNRRDLVFLARVDSVIAPDDWTLSELAYSPLPHEWHWAASQPQVVVVDQASQVFGAYESGHLVRWGPVSSGRQETPTPAGVFHLTWRARRTVSTDNKDWILNWYFNFVNSRGVSFHEFELPGRPASHACVRLLARDAQWLFGWGREWVLSADRKSVVTEGTPVVILGAFDFAHAPPWLVVDWWHAPVALPADPSK